MNMKDEMKSAEEKGCTYLPPYKLAEINKTAGKVVKLLTDNAGTVALCYEDMRTVLRIVSRVIDEGIQRGDSDDKIS